MVSPSYGYLGIEVDAETLGWQTHVDTKLKKIAVGLE